MSNHAGLYSPPGRRDTRLTDRRVRHTGPQQVSRVPQFRPGRWVVLEGGRIVRVKALTGSYTDAEGVVWRISLADGRSVRTCLVARLATAVEIEAAERREGR